MDIDKLLPIFLQNINNHSVYNGLIIASPANNNPDYYYHWIRDHMCQIL